MESFLDGDIPKELYLKKKDSVMRSTLALKEKKKGFKDKGNNWVEPLREWILDTKQAAFLSESDDYQEIKLFVQKIGTNPLVRDKSAHLRFTPPSDFIASKQAILSPLILRRRRASSLTSEEVSFCKPTQPTSRRYRDIDKKLVEDLIEAAGVGNQQIFKGKCCRGL